MFAVYGGEVAPPAATFINVSPAPKIFLNKKVCGSFARGLILWDA